MGIRFENNPSQKSGIAVCLFTSPHSDHVQTPVGEALVKTNDHGIPFVTEFDAKYSLHFQDLYVLPDPDSHDNNATLITITPQSFTSEKCFTRLTKKRDLVLLNKDRKPGISGLLGIETLTDQEGNIHFIKIENTFRKKGEYEYIGISFKDDNPDKQHGQQTPSRATIYKRKECHVSQADFSSPPLLNEPLQLVQINHEGEPIYLHSDHHRLGELATKLFSKDTCWKDPCSITFDLQQLKWELALSLLSDSPSTWGAIDIKKFTQTQPNPLCIKPEDSRKAQRNAQRHARHEQVIYRA